MSDYSKDEQAELERLRNEFISYKMGFSQLADHYAIVAHFTLKKLREERGYDHRAAEARRLRARLAEIDREVMMDDSDAHNRDTPSQ